MDPAKSSPTRQEVDPDPDIMSTPTGNPSTGEGKNNGDTNMTNDNSNGNSSNNNETVPAGPESDFTKLARATVEACRELVQPVDLASLTGDELDRHNQLESICTLGIDAIVSTIVRGLVHTREDRQAAADFMAFFHTMGPADVPAGLAGSSRQSGH